MSPGAGAAPHVARGPLFASVTANRTQTVPQGFLLPPPPIRGHPRMTPTRAGRRGESLISLRVFLHASPSGRRKSGPASDRAQSPEPLTAAVSPFPQSIPLPLSTSPKGRDPVARKIITIIIYQAASFSLNESHPTVLCLNLPLVPSKLHSLCLAEGSRALA